MRVFAFVAAPPLPAGVREEEWLRGCAVAVDGMCVGGIGVFQAIRVEVGEGRGVSVWIRGVRCAVRIVEAGWRVVRGVCGIGGRGGDVVLRVAGIAVVSIDDERLWEGEKITILVPGGADDNIMGGVAVCGVVRDGCGVGEVLRVVREDLVRSWGVRCAVKKEIEEAGETGWPLRMLAFAERRLPMSEFITPGESEDEVACRFVETLSWSDVERYMYDIVRVEAESKENREVPKQEVPELQVPDLESRGSGKARRLSVTAVSKSEPGTPSLMCGVAVAALVAAAAVGYKFAM